MNTSRTFITLIGVVSFACIAPSVVASPQVIALTGQQAPGFPNGVTYTNFLGSNTTNLPITTSAGTTAYWASTSQPPATGIWSSNGGVSSLVVKPGDPAPGTAVNFGLMSADVPVNSGGRVAFSSGLVGSSVDLSNHMGIWSNASGPLTLVARQGDHPPGVPTDVKFELSSVGSNANDLVLNDAGKVAFTAGLAGNVDVPEDSGIWSNVGGSLALVAREGDPAPGTGLNFGDLHDTRLSINVNGDIVFFAEMSDINDTALFKYHNGSLSLIAREGGQAPGMPSGTKFGDFGLYSLTDLALNAAGRVAFTTRDGTGIWSDASGPLSLVVAKGQTAPGVPGATFNFLKSPVLDHDGRVAFRASIAGLTGVTTTSDTGLWSQGSGSLRMIAREGAAAPGTAPGIVFSDFFSPSFSEDLNSAGRIAFFANVTGPGGFSGSGLWAENPSGNLTLIGFTGDQVQIAPGVFRTIGGLLLADGSGGEDGGRSGFNDAGEVTFVALMTDGSRALLTSTAAETVPEPATLSLAVFGLVLICGLGSWHYCQRRSVRGLSRGQTTTFELPA